MSDANNSYRWKTKEKEWNFLEKQMKPLVKIISGAKS